MRVPININLPKMKSGGEFRLVTRNPDGSIGQDTGWFHNLVTNLGLVQMTTVSNWASRFSVGSSGAAHSITDTALFAFLSESQGSFTDVGVNLGAPNWQGQTTRTRRFNAGEIDNVVREIGISNTTNNTNMSILATVTPEINVALPQILDASYRFTTWPALTTGAGIVNIFGDDYDYLVRMGNVQDLTRTFNDYEPDATVSRHAVYDGDIGDINNIPSGDSEAASSMDITSQGSGFCNYTVGFGVDNGNMAGGIRSIASRIVGGASTSTDPRIQVQFNNRGEGTGALNATIPKNNTREISFDLGITWDRH